jgi:hypothetical protein
MSQNLGIWELRGLDKIFIRQGHHVPLVEREFYLSIFADLTLIPPFANNWLIRVHSQKIRLT